MAMPRTRGRKAGMLVLITVLASLQLSGPALVPSTHLGLALTPSVGQDGDDKDWGVKRIKKSPRKAFDVTAIRQILHFPVKYPVMWQERWLGPANLDRANLRITGMDTYALISAVLLQVIIGLYGTVEEPPEEDDQGTYKYPRLQKYLFEIQVLALMIAVVCSTYTMVMFLLCKIYTVMALAMYKDVAYDLFQKATATHRVHAFWSLIMAMNAFLVAFALNICRRIKGNRGIVFMIITLIFIIPSLKEW
eukprot:CAMPEP_0197625046 /NCGR_PEP_ID=MMETSP1338-20131121/4512_1 /TAXON_ID=43686 ORGANISM="Pelagodinium beii, Strain RCC1491" /NCGR_SAMPLE_ID=MMETSP1338 /ASSEMBLY_ACC=CAM_ASM_000754 /LENGTH=248 /DNA_ID=CAMNT_0043195347 /DNA_START=39 /DNA_END=782 /DNA_ORIENTATION=+